MFNEWMLADLERAHASSQALADKNDAKKKREEAEKAEQAAIQAEASAKLKEQEANLLQGSIDNIVSELEAFYIQNKLFADAFLELNGVIPGTENITQVLNDGLLQTAFAQINPIEIAIANNSLDAVKLLRTNGHEYSAWQELVAQDSDMFYLLSKQDKPIRHNNAASHRHSPEHAYTALQTQIQNLVGMNALSYSELSPEQRHCTNTRLLELTKRLYDATNHPPFLLNDFSILYDADLILQQNSNTELIKALDGYVAKQINYLAGFAALNSTPPNEFVAWASNNYDRANLPIDKIVCTAFYELCQKPAQQHELSNKLTIQNTVDAEAVLAQSIGVANGLRNAVLCDGGTISSEYKQSLEKTCNQLLQSFATPAQFYHELNNSELGRILTPASKRCEYLEEISQDWERQQDLLLQNLLKQAKCEVIRQQNLQQEQARIDNFVNTYNEKHSLYTKVLAEHNQVVVDYNAFLDAANKDYIKAHKCELQADLFILSAAQNTYKSARISQNMMGTAPPSHTVEWGISLNPHEGLTFTNKHIVHRGSTVIAAGVTSYNPRIAVGARIANTLAMAQSRKNASIPTVLNYRFAELSGFVNNNGQYLSDFEAPDLQISNPYQECKIIFANEESNSKGIPVFGTNVITNTIKVDNSVKLEQLATPIMPDSFSPEANNSFNNNAIHNLQRDWTPLAQQISYNNSYWHGLVRHVNSAIYSAFSFITGSGAAEASPALVAGQLTAATTASGAIGALAPHQATAPLTFKQLGNELLDLAKKAHLLSAFLIAPTLTGNMVPLLVTPMHQPNPEDLVFPGGGVVVPDSDIPAYEGYERDAGFYNTGHANAGPRYEDVSVPPLQAHQGEELLFMYNEIDKDPNSSPRSEALKCDYVFRADSNLKPSEVFEKGFSRDGLLELNKHVMTNEKSGFISTSKSPNVCRSEEFISAGDYVYVIHHSGDGIDVNSKFKNNPYKYEDEVVFAKKIDSINIKGARMVGSDNKFIGPFIKNPNYGPKYD